MRYLKILILLLLFLNNLVFAQNVTENKFIINEIIKNQTIKKGQNAIVKNLDKQNVEYNLKPLLKKRIFKLKTKELDRIISLTKTERNFILKSIRKQYNFEWQKDDFPETKLIDTKEVLEYLKKDKENTILSISKPIYLRDNNLIVVYYLNLCCGEIMGNNSLGFYKKEDGIWKKWVEICSGSF